MQYISLVCFYVLYRWLCLGQYVVFKEVQVHNLPTNNAYCVALSRPSLISNLTQLRIQKIKTNQEIFQKKLKSSLLTRIPAEKPVMWKIEKELNQNCSFIPVIWWAQISSPWLAQWRLTRALSCLQPAVKTENCKIWKSKKPVIFTKNHSLVMR